jgi:hypothetical protein
MKRHSAPPLGLGGIAMRLGAAIAALGIVVTARPYFRTG